MRHLSQGEIDFFKPCHQLFRAKLDLICEFFFIAYRFSSLVKSESQALNLTDLRVVAQEGLAMDLPFHQSLLVELFVLDLIVVCICVELSERI